MYNLEDEEETERFKIVTEYGYFIDGPSVSKTKYQMENDDKVLGCIIGVYLPRVVSVDIVFESISSERATIDASDLHDRQF
jgi:hypothetical protein